MKEKLLSLEGSWRASENADQHRRSFALPAFEASGWHELTVPGVTQSTGTASRALLMRRTFDLGPSAGRMWLTFEGVWSRAIVWLDGAYLGEVEGYFAPKGFDITPFMAHGSEHVLAVEVERERLVWREDANLHGGLWAGVGIESTGPVRLSRCAVACTEAAPGRSILSVSAELDVEGVDQARIKTVVKNLDGETLSSTGFTRPVATGANRVKWTAIVEDSPLWWPWTHGEQPLVDVEIEVSHAGEVSDRRTLRSGLRHVTRHNGYLVVNGERIYMRGISATAPLTTLDPEASSPLIDEAKGRGVNVIDVGPWIEAPNFYSDADAAGMLVLQALPTEPGSSRISGRMRRQSVEILGHHPSIAAWTQPAPLKTLLSRLSRKGEAEQIDASRPTVDSIQPWTFDESGDEAVAALVGKWSRRARLVRFRSSPDETAPVIDELRRLKYQPLGGFLAEDLNLEHAEESLRPVSVFVHSATAPQPGRVWHGEVTVINDTAHALEDVTVTAEMEVGGEHHKWHWSGHAAADSVTVVGRFRVVIPLSAVAIEGLVSLSGADVQARRELALSLD